MCIDILLHNLYLKDLIKSHSQTTLAASGGVKKGHNSENAACEKSL